MKDRETLLAWSKKWAERGLDEKIKGKLHQNKPDPRPTDTYTILKSESDRAALVSFASEIDYRRVTNTVYALSQDALEKAMNEINAVYSDDYPRADLDFGSRSIEWMRTERQLSGGDKVEMADFTQQGQWWKGTLVYVVWATYEYGGN